MNEQLKNLIELQEIDREIIDMNRLIGSIPAKFEEAQIPLKESQQSFQAVRQKLDSLEKKKRDRERQLDDVGEKIGRLKARTSEIKTNKEYQALLSEIEAVEKERYAAEDEILVIMEEMENASRLAEAEEVRLKVEQEKIDAVKKNFEAEKAAYEQDLARMKAVRSEAARSIDEELYVEYIELIETHMGQAVTEARGEICQGCNMNIPPQLFVELKKNEEIIHCPQCRRILYYKNNDQPAEKNKDTEPV
ncbi:MAG: C4-type zinc ribbon domain-containing protein [Nitrospirota bacterium]